MQLVNGAQFLNITFLLALFAAAAPSAALLLAIIFPKQVYMHHYNQIN